MPELPEVEHARRLLQRHLVGKLVRSMTVDVADDKVFEECSKTFEKMILGKRFMSAHRKGKLLWLEADRAPHPIFHLGMTGAFFIRGEERIRYVDTRGGHESSWPPRFTKLRLQMDDGTEAAYTDPRRFGRIRLSDDPRKFIADSKLGFDALNELPDEAAFLEELEKRKRSVSKALLLDQSFGAGIGNWVADEILFQARIHPQRLVGSLSESEKRQLRLSIHNVVAGAVKVDADSNKYPRSWLFHYRWSKAKGGRVVNEEGLEIRFETVAGRTSAFAPKVQKLPFGSQGDSDGPVSKKESANKKKKNKKNIDVVEKAGEEGGGEAVSGNSPVGNMRRRSRRLAALQQDEDEGEEVKGGPRGNEVKVCDEDEESTQEAGLADSDMGEVGTGESEEGNAKEEVDVGPSGKSEEESEDDDDENLTMIGALAVQRMESRGENADGSSRRQSVTGRVAARRKRKRAPKVFNTNPRRGKA
uniref:Formamidopyrimidine-DNA glycosylase catalytic domain-containing protein n=1 Tax=Rhodosorus marinus TaxID=101924 RepID=A0A7S3EJG4_9RHOD|mmetsp:Transcript_40926/g.162082  ORF Transcript_40926/g.162082 Transcript_40926/m.162082 type:complete len:474 (+) Transcript_40926:535-1956(+)